MMLKTGDNYIRILSGIFIILLVVLALIDGNKIDYLYIGLIFILIFKNVIERFIK